MPHVRASARRRRRARLPRPPRQRRHSAADPSTAAGGELTIYGAASLKGALDKAKTAYEAANPGTTLTISTDSSSALETQIEQGAPADVFLSADTTNPQKLVDKGLADGGPVDVRRQQADDRGPDGQSGRHHVARPTSRRPGSRSSPPATTVPITKYATQLVANLAKQAGYPADFVAAYTANIVSREDNVKALIAKVELGEGDAGIVYVTDAKASTKVKTIDVPDSANVPATYDGVVVKASRNAAAARAFLDWFAGPDGQAILGSLGFLPPLVIEDVAGRPAGVGRRRGRPGRRARSGRWGERSLTALAALFALFLGLPVVTLVARAILDGSLRGRPRVPGRPRRPVAEPRHDGDQPGHHCRPRPAARVRARPPPVPGQGLARGDRRPADRPAAVGRRPRPAARLRPSRAAGGAVRVPRRLGPVHDRRGDPRPDVRVGARSSSARRGPGIAGVDRDLEDAARVDGASERQLFRSITVPLASAALAAGLVMSWARSLGEFGATIMFAGNVEGRTQTLPLVVYGEFQGGDLDAVDRGGGDPGAGRVRCARRRPGLPLGPSPRRPGRRVMRCECRPDG